MGQRFDLVIKIHKDFVQRHRGRQHHTSSVDRFGVLDFAAFLHDQLHHVPYVFIRAHDETFHHWLANFLDHARVRQKGGVIDIDGFAICFYHVIDHARIGRDNIHVELATEPLLDNLHVK